MPLPYTLSIIIIFNIIREEVEGQEGLEVCIRKLSQLPLYLYESEGVRLELPRY